MATNRPSGPPSAPPKGPSPSGWKPPAAGLGQMRSGRFWLMLLILLLLNVFITNVVLAPQPPKSVVIPYDVFKEQVQADNVVNITSIGDAISGASRNPVS